METCLFVLGTMLSVPGFLRTSSPTQPDLLVCTAAVLLRLAAGLGFARSNGTGGWGHIKHACVAVQAVALHDKEWRTVAFNIALLLCSYVKQEACGEWP